MIERRGLGVIEVDSGTLIVGDPAYALHEKARGTSGIDYQAVLDVDASIIASRLDNKPLLLIQRFGGDGAYAIIGEFEDDELVRLVVDFDPLGDEADDE